MIPKLLHIYSDVYINSYGLAIAIGLGIFTWCLQRDSACKKLLNNQKLLSIIQTGIFIAIISGRIGMIITSPEQFDHWWEWFMIWQGGFSLLVSILGLVFLLPFYLEKIDVPILLFLDRCALYAPLLQAISRIGCFFAGCCGGKPTDVWWSITYSNPECMADLHIPLHPTQLYSTVILFMFFLLLYYVIQEKTKKPGQLFYWYLWLISLERFTVDCLRADQTFFDTTILNVFSVHQWIALSIFLGSTIALLSGSGILRLNKFLLHHPSS